MYEGCSKSFDVLYEANMVQGCNFIYINFAYFGPLELQI